MHKEKNQQEINYNTSKNISDDRKLEEHFQKGKKRKKNRKKTNKTTRKTTTQMKQTLKSELSSFLQGFVTQIYEQSLLRVRLADKLEAQN